MKLQETARPTGRLADHERALVAEVARLRARNAELVVALAHSRLLGMAIGIVAERLKIRVDAAERVLETVADDLQRPVIEIADHLVRTGTLP